MKLIAIMSLAEDKESVRGLMEKSGVQIYSETAILGHSTSTVEGYGWFSSKAEAPYYSTLCFAALPDERAGEILAAITRLNDEKTSDHPIRAFQVGIEKMV
jgi:hypothetical protein